MSIRLVNSLLKADFLKKLKTKNNNALNITEKVISSITSSLFT